jgi:gliding motility-associated-like protein
MEGTCVQQTVSVVVDVIDVPGVTVEYSGSDIICTGQTKLYTIYPQPSNFTYQWSSVSGGDIAGATNSTFTATSSGKYFVKLQSTVNTSCAAIQTASKKIRVAQTPTVNFSAPSTGCVSQNINFGDQSTVDIDPDDTEVDYNWDFGDSGTATTTDASHDFATAQTFNVTHSVSYRNKSCLASKILAIQIQGAPSVAITTTASSFTFCPGDSLQLQVLGNFTSYSWSTGSTASSIYVKEVGDVSVNVTTASCAVTATKTIAQFAAPTVTATAYRSPIKAGDTTRLHATGLATFLWEPNNTILIDSLIANPVVSPPTTTTFTVSGKDVNGCLGSASVELTVVPDKALNSLKASKFFSPNADGINDVWLVDNAPTLNQCGVAIYDERGFKVFDAKPYLNNWDGTSTQGKALPAGVYYYVFKCDDSSGYAGGSINIIR